MDNVVINITETPNQVTANITENPIIVTINVTVGGGGLQCADLAACQTIIDIEADISTNSTNINTVTNDLSTHESNTSNPHNVTKAQVGLSNVDNTSDINKPVSTSQAIAIAVVQSDIDIHEALTNNPHDVTLEQARSENSSISGDINANNNTIINLKDAVNPQEPITKIQFDTYVSAVGGQRGDIDCSANPNYPASNKGDRWEVVVAGKIGGALGINVDVYDEIVCKTNSVAGNQATVGANFYIVQGNIERATETTSGYIQLATDAEVQAGTENTKAFTSLKLQNWWVNIKTLAQTFAAKITFTTAPRFNSTAAFQYLKVDANKDLTSVSTIPATDIIDDSTHRFATDTEKANWNNKPVFAFVSGTDFTTTSLSLTDVTGLTAALDANSVYEFMAKLTIESSSNAGLNTGVNFSAAGATIEAGEIGARDTEVGKVSRISAFNSSAAAAWVRISATPQTHEIKGIIRTGANPGNLTIKVLKTTSGTAKVYIDSYLKTTKI